VRWKIRAHARAEKAVLAIFIILQKQLFWTISTFLENISQKYIFLETKFREKGKGIFASP
jgi:hypothetical protein